MNPYRMMSLGPCLDGLEGREGINVLYVPDDVDDRRGDAITAGRTGIREFRFQESWV